MLNISGKFIRHPDEQPKRDRVDSVGKSMHEAVQPLKMSFHLFLLRLIIIIFSVS